MKTIKYALALGALSLTMATACGDKKNPDTTPPENPGEEVAAPGGEEGGEEAGGEEAGGEEAGGEEAGGEEGGGEEAPAEEAAPAEGGE